MGSKGRAAIIGLGLALVGLGLLGYGVYRLSGDPNSGNCGGDECLADPWFLAFPGGIIAIVFGLIIASWALGAWRDERMPTGPLRAFGFMTGLGTVFVVMAAIFLASRDADDTFLFLAVLFGVMGLCFIGVDLVRFRGELRKDRLRMTGLKGTATIVAVRNSNVTINNSPLVNLDLDVSIPGQSPFRATRRTVLSPQTGLLMAGSTVAVLADPAKPRDIVLDWESTPKPDPMASFRMIANPADMATILGGVRQAMAGVGAPTAMQAETLRELSQALGVAAQRAEHGELGHGPDGTIVVDGGTTVLVNGLPVSPSGWGAIAAQAAPTSNSTAPEPTASETTAPDDEPAAPADMPVRVTIDTLQQTGVDASGDHVYALDLTVLPAGRRPYQIKQTAAVPAALTGRLVRGASFPARINPSQPGAVTVLWDR